MQTRRGTSGLTQKEAIFRIFKHALGTQFYPGMDVKKVLCTKPNSYGRAKWDSSYLNRIIHEVYEGLCNGTIPSKLNSNSEGHSESYFNQLRREYANRITHYWMKNDKRLNGAVSGSRMATDKKKRIVLTDRLNSDPALRAMKALYIQQQDDAAKFEIETYLMGRVFSIVLETYGIDLNSLPQEVREYMKIDQQTDKQEAA